MKPHRIAVVEWSSLPGSRFVDDGERSGEQYRNDVLEPAYLAAREAGAVLEIDLDDVEGYATSFLEEAFGGLVRGHGQDVIGRLKFICEDDPLTIREVETYMLEASEV